jgi:hypothetical protein
MQMAQANASLAARLPELEAAPEPRESGLSASEERGTGDEEVPPEPEQRRSWLNRFFFGK